MHEEETYRTVLQHVYDQEMIYEGMIGLMSSNRSVPIDTGVITDVVFQ